MSSYTEDGGGCLFPIFLTGLILFGLLMMGSGDHTHTNTNTTPVLSGNEVLSRNQFNVLSDVHNTYMDCMGAYSCVVTDTSTVITSTSSTSTNIDGDRNVIYASNGALLCPNPDKPNEWGDVAAWCAAAGVQP